MTETASSASTSQAPGSGKATASVILGIASIVFCWFLIIGAVVGALAIILGIWARVELTRAGATRGVGSAHAGIVTGVIGIIASIILVSLTLSFGPGTISDPDPNDQSALAPISAGVLD